MKKLLLPALQTFLIGGICLGLLLFLPAGTLNYWQGWLFIVVFSLATNGVGIYLSINDPALLERRKKFGPGQEQRLSQKIIMGLILFFSLGILVFCALSHRFGWSPVPTPVVLLGDALIVMGLYITVLVMRVNSYSASNIRIEEGQTVISTGPYALVRHPMYTGALIMIIGVPLALDAWLGLVVVALSLTALVWRILDEEKALRQDLPGYTDYAHKVRYRLVPGLW